MRRAASFPSPGRTPPCGRRFDDALAGELAGEAERMLSKASTRRQLGRFQLEAAIQAAYVDRRRTGRTDWGAITHLYEGLLTVAPSLGAAVAHAAAVAQSGDLTSSLALLDGLDRERAASYQPYWATRAFVLAANSDGHEARACYQQAAGLTEDEAVRAYLLACSLD